MNIPEQNFNRRRGDEKAEAGSGHGVWRRSISLYRSTCPVGTTVIDDRQGFPDEYQPAVNHISRPIDR